MIVNTGGTERLTPTGPGGKHQFDWRSVRRRAPRERTAPNARRTCSRGLANIEVWRTSPHCSSAWKADPEFVDYPDEQEERKIYRLTAAHDSEVPQAVLSGEEMLQLQAIVRKVPVSDLIVDYVASLVRSTRPKEGAAPQFIRDWVLWGVGPRGGQSLIAAAQARAALDGRPQVEVEDIKAVATPVLRHRLVLNYNAESQGQTPETVVRKLIDETPLHPTAQGASERVERLLKA